MKATQDSQNEMMRQLSPDLPRLVPLAAAWVRAEEHKAISSGKPLAPWQAIEARNVGVSHVDRVRVCLVDTMPMPRDPALANAARMTGLILSTAAGLTLGHAILILRVHAGERRLLRHELRHVAQYQSAGSIEGFLAEYIDQVVRHGYMNAPLEVDARRFETGTRLITKPSKDICPP